MRLPNLDEDAFELRSGEDSHRSNPSTFWIPDRVRREALVRGDAAKIILDIASVDEDGTSIIAGERVWVIVREKIDDTYLGILDNQPTCLEFNEGVYPVFGAEIPFRAEHVVDIARPPDDYIEWQLDQQPERLWPRVADVRPSRAEALDEAAAQQDDED